MTNEKALYLSPKGGSIVCLQGNIRRIFRSCTATKCLYSADLHSAKSNLNQLESNKKILSPGKDTNLPSQRKTTLKWNDDGSLSAIDMTRIMNRLEQVDLTTCELSCNWNC